MGWWGGIVGVLAWALHARSDKAAESLPRLWQWLSLGLATGAGIGVLTAIWIGWSGPLVESALTDYRPLVRQQTAEHEAAAVKRSLEADNASAIAPAKERTNRSGDRNQRRGRRR